MYKELGFTKTALSKELLNRAYLRAAQQVSRKAEDVGMKSIYRHHGPIDPKDVALGREYMRQMQVFYDGAYGQNATTQLSAIGKVKDALKNKKLLNKELEGASPAKLRRIRKDLKSRNPWIDYTEL